MKKIKVLVVDDSAFMRMFISDMINGETDMEVVATARNGDDAIKKLGLYDPDVVTLDVEMPGRSGLEVIKDIKRQSKPEVIMVSSLTSKGSSTTIRALEAGAFDFIEKPTNMTTSKASNIKVELATKIRYAAGGKDPKDESLETKRVTPKPSPTHVIGLRRINAVALGASTGGPKVLYETLTKFPDDLAVPVFVVQHMPAGFTKAFAERLDNSCRLKIVEARDEDVVKPGVVYIAPGGFHMLVEKGRIILDTSAPLHGVKPAVDKLFDTAAREYGSGLLCCVFTGMGRDGARGVEAVKKGGGIVMAQDESTSVIYGMPKAAYETGCVDLVLPCDKISGKIVDLVKGKI